MFKLFRRIAASMSGARKGGGSGNRKAQRGAGTRRATGGRRGAVAGAKAREGIGRGVPTGSAESAPPDDRGGYVQPIREPVLIHDEDWAPEWDERSKTEQHIIKETTESRLKSQEALMQHMLSQETALWGMQNSQQMSNQMAGLDQQMAGLDAQMRQIVGMGQDPLSGIPRDRPYWQSMYGNLGMHGGFNKSGK